MINEVDDWIKQGEIPKARRALRQLVETKLSRENLLKAALLALRADQPMLGIRLLNPLVRPPARSASRATREEIAEYAACLTRIGASEEANSLLEPLDAKSNPRVLLYRYIALVTQWEYEKGIPLIREYLSRLSPGDYQFVVAEVNLAAALIHERHHKEASELIGRILAETQESGFRLLRANTLGLAISNAVYQKKWNEAEERLNEARSALPDAASLDEFLLRKWGAILALMRKKPTPGSLGQVNKIREEAARRAHWETLRDCDRFRAFATRDKNLITRLYFGTPFASFRKWLLLGYGEAISIPAEYRWRPGAQPGRGKLIDLGMGETIVGAIRPEHGDIPLRLLKIVSSDFYRPFRLATLHHLLFPGEFFNPASSPLRVHQALNRLKKWKTANRVPLQIQHQVGWYRLKATGPCEIRVVDSAQEPEAKSPIHKLQKHLANRPFRLQEVTELLDLSSRSALRVVQDGLQAGSLEKLGAGKTTRYRFTKKAA